MPTIILEGWPNCDSCNFCTALRNSKWPPRNRKWLISRATDHLGLKFQWLHPCFQVSTMRWCTYPYRNPYMYDRKSTWRPYTGSRLHLRNGKSYRRDSNGYPHIFHHALFTKVTGDIVRQLLLPYFNMANTKPEVDCISETE